MANPEIQWVSPATQVTKEGCLSVPGHYANVVRPLEIKVSYLDENNQNQTLNPQEIFWLIVFNMKLIT